MVHTLKLAKMTLRTHSVSECTDMFRPKCLYGNMKHDKIKENRAVHRSSVSMDRYMGGGILIELGGGGADGSSYYCTGRAG